MQNWGYVAEVTYFDGLGGIGREVLSTFLNCFMLIVLFREKKREYIPDAILVSNGVQEETKEYKNIILKNEIYFTWLSEHKK